MSRINRRAFAAGSAALAFAPYVGRAEGKKPLRFVQNGNLTILDPIWTTAYVTRDHGYMIYDTLFATDESNAVQPQMVDKHEVSADKLTWTFTLRDGLEWHDGKPVTAEDCVASLKRWGARDPMGQKLMDFVAELKASGDKTFVLTLKEPYGLVLDTLGKPSSNVPFMMPKRIADTDPFKQIDSQVGSGPFIYVNAESKPGEKHVYIRNPKYKPRAEPASALAGGKVAKVERVEFVDMPDPQQQVNALIAGEIDMVEQVPHDLIPILKGDKGVQIVDWNPLGQQFVIRFNHLTKPFDNPKIRLAALYCMRQEDYLKATVGDPKYYKVCTAAFVCGTPNGVEIQGDLLTKPDFEKSKALLKEAGYDGSPVVLMQSTTLAGADQHGAGHQGAARAGRLQGRHAVDGLADGGHAPRQEGSGRQGRLERLPHLRHRRRYPEPDRGQLHGRQRRQGVVRLAQRSRDGKAARRLRQGDRSGQGQGSGRRGAGARARDRAVRLARPVVRTGRRAQQPHRLAEGAGDGAVEHRQGLRSGGGTAGSATLLGRSCHTLLDREPPARSGSSASRRLAVRKTMSARGVARSRQ